MKRTRILWALSAMLLALAATAEAAGDSSTLPPAGYDESRDPAADLKAAVAQARRENKRILLEVGGDWRTRSAPPPPRLAEARSEFKAAATLTRNVRERAFLLARADACDGQR